MRFIHCNTKKEFTEAAGFDWFKIVKVEGGYIGFNTQGDYMVWKNNA
jgi:hypothetical protein